MPPKRKLEPVVVDAKRVDDMKYCALKLFAGHNNGLQLFKEEPKYGEPNYMEFIVKDKKKCEVCGVNNYVKECYRCEGRICDNELCQTREDLCCICYQIGTHFTPCEACHKTYICEEDIDRVALLEKADFLRSQEFWGHNPHPFQIKNTRCPKCALNLCEECTTYKGACVECSKKLPDIWYKAIGAKVLDIATKVADPDNVPDPVAEDGDVTASGAPLTILRRGNLKKGPYAKCCGCDKRWLYDSGLPNKGKPCDCECAADEEENNYCRYFGFDPTEMMICDDSKAFSDEERHLVIQKVFTCCSSDYLHSLTECSSKFVFPDDIAINVYKGPSPQKYVCSICAEKYMTLFCADCDAIFEDAAKLEEHKAKVHNDE
jgi:hypothetical protein